MNSKLQAIVGHQHKLRACTRCANMIGPVVTGSAVQSPILLIGQAPGAREGEMGKPFAWTAGKTLFRWFEGIGLEEVKFRSRVYMAAVCRCFPGKNPNGGDRVPAQDEIANCAGWLETELELLCPQLVLPVGKLAISQLMPVEKLTDVIGRKHQLHRNSSISDVIPLPHPSGASTWHRMQPGKSLLQQALQMIQAHPAWHAVCAMGY